MFLSEVHIYPVKSLRGIIPRSARVERRGLGNDRRWMLVGDDNRFLTQREFPKMAAISTALNSEDLLLGCEGREIRVPLQLEAADVQQVEVWGDLSAAEISSPVVNEWLSEVLGTRCRLVRMPDETRRPVNADYAVRADDHVSFADGFPFLLIGEASLGELNSRLRSPVPMDRFRPNLVVSGTDAFAEDSWKKIRIGETVFHVVKGCGRCVITTIDQAKGVKTGVEPLRTLAEFRTFERKGAKRILFGQNLIAETVGAEVSVGDAVEVLV